MIRGPLLNVHFVDEETSSAEKIRALELSSTGSPNTWLYVVHS